MALLKRNASFRRLWIGNVVSLFGDWFNTIALYSLVLRLSGSEFALGAVFVTKLLPWAIAAPIAGVLVDRFNRRRIMLMADVLRALVVLGFLVIDERSEVYLVYVITTLQVVIGSVFHPAQTASIPNLTRSEDLLTANTLMAATWSVLLAFGAAVGGIAADFLGLKAVFLIDSASYMVSAFFIYRAVIPQDTVTDSSGSIFRLARSEVLSGWRHIISRPQIGRFVLAKASWALGGGACVYMLALLGETMAPGREAAAIGVLFAARGIGTGIGPILGRLWFRDHRNWPRLLGIAIMFSGTFYVVIGFMPWSYLILIPIVFAHSASGLNWVFSTVLLQERTTDAFRGRVFSTDWLAVMSADTISILTASLVLESGLLELRQAILFFAGVQIVTGLIWLKTVVPRESAFLRKDILRIH